MSSVEAIHSVRRQSGFEMHGRPDTPTTAYLRVSSVLKCVEDFFQRDGVSSFLIHGFPHDAIRLQVRRMVVNFLRDSEEGCSLCALCSSRIGLTPFPSFCWISYFRSTCLSISSLMRGKLTSCRSALSSI